MEISSGVLTIYSPTGREYKGIYSIFMVKTLSEPIPFAGCKFQDSIGLTCLPNIGQINATCDFRNLYSYQLKSLSQTQQ